jgi:hypothetical protein
MSMEAVPTMVHPVSVIPAKAGIDPWRSRLRRTRAAQAAGRRIPAFGGMTASGPVGFAPE